MWRHGNGGLGDALQRDVAGGGAAIVNDVVQGAEVDGVVGDTGGVDRPRDVGRLVRVVDGRGAVGEPNLFAGVGALGEEELVVEGNHFIDVAGIFDFGEGEAVRFEDAAWVTVEGGV